jgi:hypothetical protein
LGHSQKIDETPCPNVNGGDGVAGGGEGSVECRKEKITSTSSSMYMSHDQCAVDELLSEDDQVAEMRMGT